MFSGCIHFGIVFFTVDAGLSHLSVWSSLAGRAARPRARATTIEDSQRCFSGLGESRRLSFSRFGETTSCLLALVIRFRLSMAVWLRLHRSHCPLNSGLSTPICLSVVWPNCELTFTVYLLFLASQPCDRIAHNRSTTCIQVLSRPHRCQRDRLVQSCCVLARVRPLHWWRSSLFAPSCIVRLVVGQLDAR